MDYMDKIEQSLDKALNKAAERIRTAELPGDLAAQFEKLATQVYQPCIVAVVGQVKAGKSSFINALLGEDLARVGKTETTATINYFRYRAGKIASDFPVRCFWRNGRYKDVDLAFLDGLQGNDIETLRRTDGIDHLEYYLPDADLERITLVDTPGTGAVVDEHQNLIAEFLHLQRQLRERHHKETRELGDSADAVIYLIGAVAGSADQKFLEEFSELTQGESRAFNAVGVMSKIDLYPETVERREELSRKIAEQLKENLNAVVPVSAGMRRALDGLLKDNRAELKRLIDALRTIPPEKLNLFLSSPKLYLMPGPDWPLPIEQRQELRGTMEWRVFATIARVAADRNLDLDMVEKRLNAIAGFDRLREVLDRHIFQRSRLLRCYRIVNDARRLVSKLRYLPELRIREREDRQRLGRFLTFIQAARGDPAVASELEAFVRGRLMRQAGQIEAIVNELDRDFAAIFHELEQYNADFEALQLVTEHTSLFSTELNELETLLGLYGLETEKRLSAGRMSLEYVKERQGVWYQVSMLDRDPIRRQVAQQAVARYGFIMEEIIGMGTQS